MVKRKHDLENFELPVWQNLSARWYAKVNKLARTYEISRAELLQEAVSLFERYQKTLNLKKVGVKEATEEDIRKVFGGFAKSWWESLTPEQRKVEAKKRSAAAKARWAKQRGRK